MSAFSHSSIHCAAGRIRGMDATQLCLARGRFPVSLGSRAGRLLGCVRRIYCWRMLEGSRECETPGRLLLGVDWSVSDWKMLQRSRECAIPVLSLLVDADSKQLENAPLKSRMRDFLVVARADRKIWKQYEIVYARDQLRM